MPTTISSFDSEGYVVIENILSDEAIVKIEKQLMSLPNGGAGTRNLLNKKWCKHLSQSVAVHPLISVLLPTSAVAVQCTYFSKSLERNWLVSLHKDYVIPLKEKFSADGWSMWSVKEDVHYARAPNKVLETMVAVRVHLEANTAKNGPLQVVPRSHKSCSQSGARAECIVNKGGALAMRPLILHASSKIIEGQRRVLHFLYGSAQLPKPAEWANAVQLIEKY
jgi:ectoine hydroxylase-related dioxygenase (phytanoyl-CoA dioxygenase family)